MGAYLPLGSLPVVGMANGNPSIVKLDWRGAAFGNVLRKGLPAPSDLSPYLSLF
jgi:hypothetical protein